MVRYPMWVMLGIVSGLLWGCNNYLYGVGASAAGAGLAVGIDFPLACTAVQYVRSLADPASFSVPPPCLAGRLVSSRTALASCGRDRPMRWRSRPSILLLAVFWRACSCISRSPCAWVSVSFLLLPAG